MHRYFIYCRKSTEDDDHQSLSLDSQVRELTRFAAEHALPIVGTICESASAKMPGRPLFVSLLKRIARGEAEGIIAWHPDRLARNAIDGGQIIHFLDTKKLMHLRFPTFTFDNSPQGKFMLAIMFGHSKYEVDTLSEHVKRGNRAKRELGWLPGLAPIGYLNVRSDSGAKIIARDPERFPVIQKLWRLFLSGGYSGMELLDVAKAEFGLRTRRRWRTGGGEFSRSCLYRILRSPFYTGHIVFEGQWYPGNHEPMISVDDFNQAQKLLHGTRCRPRRYHFAYAGMIRCGNCNAAVTAQKKINRYGSRYIYYHCTRTNKTIPCREPYIEERELERQIVAIFSKQETSKTALVQNGNLRSLLALRASSITLQNKLIRIVLRSGFDSREGTSRAFGEP